MGLKCFFGMHDWHTISCKSGNTLKSEVAQEFRNALVASKRWFLEMHYRKKICLECGKRLDEMERAKDILRDEFFRKQSRLEKAKKLLRNSSNVMVRYNSDTWTHRCYACGNTGLNEYILDVYTCNKCGQRHESF